MPNMSYCRFTNTRGDLTDCLDAIQYEEHLSAAEVSAGKRMFKEFLNFCRDHDIIGEYDHKNIDEMFDYLKEAS